MQSFLGIEIKDWVTLLSAAFFSLYIIVLAVFFFYARHRRSEYFDRFSKALVRGIDTGKIKDVEDCLDIAKGIVERYEDAELRPRVIKWLHQFIVRIVSDQVSFSPSTKSNDAKSLVTSFIRELEKTDPFSQLPSAERGVVSDILRSISTNDLTLADSKTRDLAHLIEARAEHVSKLEKTNKYSMPLAIVGLLLTIIFGMASLL